MAYYNDPTENPEYKRNQWIAGACVAVVYAALLIFFIAAGLTHQVPPPPEYGIELDMSGGGGGGASASVSAPADETPAAQAAPRPTSARVSTQRVEATHRVASEQPKTTSNTVQDNPQPEVNQSALFRKKKGQLAGGQGTGAGSGSGSGTGAGSGSGSGGGDGSGTGTGDDDGFKLYGRSVVHRAYPKGGENLNGIVVVEFRADRDGKVVYAKAGGRGTTINNAALWDECERAAMKSIFNKNADAAAEEKGTIHYKFVPR